MTNKITNNNNNNFKKFEVIEHLSDVMVQVYGRTLEELFENAAYAMFSIITDVESINKVVLEKAIIEVKQNIEIEDLLIIWLEKLLFLIETKNLIFSDFKIKNLIINENESKIDAVLKGEKINLQKHEFFLQIKAPTYHELKIIKDDNSGIYRTKIIFDV